MRKILCILMMMVLIFTVLCPPLQASALTWPSTLGGYEGYYRIKHVQTGKYLTAVTSGTNQYGLTLSASSTSSYQRWRIKTVSVSGRSYNIINGGYTTHYLSTNTGAPIYYGNHLDAYKSRVYTTAFTCVLPKVSGSSTKVYIRNSTASWALETNYSTDTSPQFYDNSFEGSALGEWIFECVYMKGDVNQSGSVTQADYELALNAAVGITTLTSLQIFLADINNDGSVTTTDARAIMNMV